MLRRAWHYFVDACVSYSTQNSSTDGLGCDRTSHGTGYADQYEPAVRDMLSNVTTCPREQLLFFHHLSWSHPMALSNGSTVPLIDYIAITSEHALEEARQMAADWDTLEGLVDAARFGPVQARFRQQNVDAISFSEVIVGFYLNISGHRFPEGRGSGL